MSKFLYKIGRTAYKKPWYFIVGWLVVLGIVLGALGLNGISVSSEMRIEGTESQKVLDQLTRELPAASGGQGSVVFTVPDGQSLQTPERAAAIGKAVKDVYSLDHLVNPVALAAASSEDAAPAESAAEPPQADAGAAPSIGPLMVDGAPMPGVLLSADGSVALFQFQFTEQIQSLPAGVSDSVIAAVNKAGIDTGITVLPSDSLQAMEPPMGTNEIFGLVVAALVLILTLGSLIGAGLPLATALVGVGIGVGGAYALSSIIDLNSATPTLALMIGLAVGIDYALFIVNRQRRLILTQGLSAKDATSRAIGTAGSAVFFAGLTVIIALCGLSIIGIIFLTTMALVAAATVLVAVLIALTLLPALLGLVGERICSQKARETGRVRIEKEHRGFAHRWVSGVVRFRWPVIIGVVVILGVSAIPMTSMELGIPSGATANKDSVSRQSYDAISRAFGEGFNGSLVVVVEPTNGSDSITPELLAGVTKDLQALDDVSMVSPMSINESGKMAILNVIPDSGPGDAKTKDLVERLRDPESGVSQAHDVTLGVTGITAITIDISAKLGSVFPIYIAIILGLSLMVLLLVFRSIAIPIKATVGFLFSILATFGLTTAVFQWGWLKHLFGFDTGGPLVSFIPIIITGILFGLAMDYEVFLVSSMRESHVHGHRGIEGVVHGFDQTSRVVLGAAVIMVSIFAGFIFADNVMIKQMGFAMAAGIVIDAFIVRMTLVPAVIAVLGERAWWLPKWLDRLLPNLDVEGDKLMAELKSRETRTPDSESPSVDQAARSRRDTRIIAVPSVAPGGLEAERSGHFGHCDMFTLVKVEDNTVAEVGVVNNLPHGEGGCLDPVRLLASLGTTDIVVGGMGARPLAYFAELGITVYADPHTPTVQAVIDALLAGDVGVMTPGQVCGGGSCH
jgi:RND superfamily putative drug exporter